jgi:hypothetical protein
LSLLDGCIECIVVMLSPHRRDAYGVSGSVDPTFDRLLGLIRACGFDLDIRVVPLDEDAWTLAERGASASPDERLDRMLAGVDLLEAGREARGDPSG